MKVAENDRRGIMNLYSMGKGTDTIAQEFGFGKTTIRTHLLNLGVKFRPANNEIVSKDLHKKFIKLYKRGLSIRKIAKQSSSTFSTVQRHLHKENIRIKLRGYPHSISSEAYKLTREKAYILGVVGPGDGFLDRNRKYGNQVALEVVDFDFLKYFATCLERVYGIKPSIKKLKLHESHVRPHYKARLYSVAACDDILSYDANFKEKTWSIPNAIKGAQKEIKKAYIQGFADSQGCVVCHPTCREIRLCSKNKTGSLEMIELLRSMGIDCSYYQDHIRIGKYENIKAYADNINFIMLRKHKTLSRLLKSYKKFGEVQEI